MIEEIWSGVAKFARAHPFAWGCIMAIVSATIVFTNTLWGEGMSMVETLVIEIAFIIVTLIFGLVVLGYGDKHAKHLDQ